MSFRVLPHSIVARMLLLGMGLVLIAATARYVMLTTFLHKDISELVQRQQLTIAEFAARDIDDKIVRREAYLKDLAHRMPAQALTDEARRRAWLGNTDALQTLFSAGLLMTDPDGRLLAGSRPALPRPPVVLPLPLHLPLQDGESAIGAPWLVVGTRATLPTMVPITGRDGRLAAVLIGLTYLDDPAFLGHIISHTHDPAQGGLIVVSPQDHLFIASTQSGMALQPTPPAGVNPLHDRAMNGFRGSGVTRNAQGIEEISAMVSVPSTGWFVVSRVPTATALITVAHTQSFLFRSAGMSIVVFLSMFAGIVYLLLRPLLRATALAEKMTLGDAPLRPLPISTADEVGKLLGAFNRLLDKLDTQNNVLALAAQHDALTGLPNRVLLADRLSQALGHAARHGNAVGVLYLDLDEFKPINDRYGHETGDRVLQEVASRLTRLLRGTDSVARIGGDEFVVLLSEVAQPAEPVVEQIATNIVQAIDQPVRIGSIECHVGVSIGCAIGDGNSSPASLLLHADHLMYKAKAQGRGRYVIDRPDEASDRRQAHGPK